MSKIYTQRTASLRATTIDAQTLDTRNILIYPGEGGNNVRKNLLTLIKEKDDALNETISSLSSTLSENIAATDSRLVKVEEDIVKLNESVNNEGGGGSIDGNLASRFEEFMTKNFAYLDSSNVFSADNTFKKTIIAEDGVHATSGDIAISDGVLTFEDLVDGTVVKRSGVSGYQYIPEIPVNFENGVCYDIGEISDLTNLSNVRFTGEGKLVQTCELWFTTPATPPTAHKWPTGIYWIDSNTGAAPTLLASKNYRLVFRQEPNKIIASIAYIY